MYKLIVDISTSRILWFTSNVKDNVNYDSDSSIAFFQGEMPPDINLENCWKYVFLDKKIIKKTQEVGEGRSLFELNKESVASFIEEKIKEARLKKYPVSIFDFYINYFCQTKNNNRWLGLFNKSNIDGEQVTKKETQELENFLFNTESLKLFALSCLDKAQDNKEVFAIKTNFLKEINILIDEKKVY